MDILYSDARHGVKWQEYQVPPQVSPQLSKKSRPRLAGTAHKPGWPEQVRALRGLLKVLHARSPWGVPGGSERVSLEVIELIDRLDPHSLHVLRVCFSELFKLSQH
jgi:hypothetical protein